MTSSTDLSNENLKGKNILYLGIQHFNLEIYLELTELPTPDVKRKKSRKELRITNSLMKSKLDFLNTFIFVGFCGFEKSKGRRSRSIR